MTIDGIKLKFRNKVYLPLTCNYRRRKIKHDDFTIISNNCWGGMIYESYGLMKNSPTVGLFFMAQDYIKFLTNLKEYINAELRFISPGDSRWAKEASADSRFGSYPIGVLEIIGGGKQIV